MSLLRTLLTTLAIGLGVAAPAQAVVGGNDASPGEYPYVAHLLIDRAFQCTGTLVTPTHVVTAAHCSSIVPGGVAPGWLGLGSVSSDVAVVELDRPSAKTPVKIASAAERSLWSAGTLATIVGYGATESGGESPEIVQEARVPIVADADAAEAYP